MAKVHLRNDPILAQAFIGRRVLCVLHHSGKLTIRRGASYSFKAAKVRPNLTVAEVVAMWQRIHGDEPDFRVEVLDNLSGAIVRVEVP